MHVNVITFFSEKEISQLPNDSTKVFKTNKVDLCIYRPNHVYASRKYAVLDSFCYAEFLRYYYYYPYRVQAYLHSSQVRLAPD